MKTFLLKDNTPIIKWGTLPNEVYYEGAIPIGYDLAVAPNQPYIIIDIDNKNGKNGSSNIPIELKNELSETFFYRTKNNGYHVWFKYTGDKVLRNTTSKLGIDLRIGGKIFSKTEWTCGGYVKWHPRDTLDIRDCIHLINETSNEMNSFIELLFS